MKFVSASDYWSLHTHSRFSSGDALPKVEDIVAKAAELKYPAIGLTDHGNVAGSVLLYKEAQKRGLKPFPGSELYYVPSTEQYKADRANKDVKSNWFHMGVHAYSTQGYENLVKLSTATHRNHFHKPLCDAALLGEFSENGWLEGLAVTTGCHFGLAVQSLIKTGPGATKQWLHTLQSWFPGAVYVEAQQHNIDHEEHEGWDDQRVCHELYLIAQELSLPMVITQDSHYVDKEDKSAHETLKRLSSWSDTPDDATFPGDGFHMVHERWMREHHAPHVFNAGIEGLTDLLQRHTLAIPVLDDYVFTVPETVKDPSMEMWTRVSQFLTDEELSQEYWDKAAEEIAVIDETGMAAYMMLVAQITDYCRERGWLFQTRGSAAGSVVAWALGISNVDPIHWDLRFERFLSKDRTKPPDIDLDIQHDKREELIEWLRKQYYVTAIGTWQSLSMNPDEEGKGSILRKYYQMQGKIGGPQEWDDVPREDRQAMYELDKHDATSGMGKNAAGVIITNDPESVARLVPMHYSTSVEEGIAQYHKKDVEALGFVKMDILGSKTLSVLARACKMLGRDLDTLLPITRETDRMKVASTDVFREISKGMTDGIFQLEGYSNKKGCMDLKPKSVHDIIAAMALFRPAVLDSGATDAYISRKNGTQRAPERHSVIDRVTKQTHGIILFQEQVIDLLRELGMGADDLTEFLGAVKASNKDIDNAAETIAEYMPWIEQRCADEGFSTSDIAWLKDAFDAFGGYSFNRAHSTVYGLTAWRCAYFAHTWGLEFHTALLDVASEGADRKKETRYVQAARKRGIKVSRASINVSGTGYTADRDRGLIRRGLTSVETVGQIVARDLVAHRGSGYKSLDDLITRTEGTKVSGGEDWRKIKRANARKPGSRYYREEPPTTDDLNGNIKAMLDAGVLNEILEDA